MIARAAVKNVEIAYLCGLLHNVGAPLVINRVTQLEPKLAEQDVVELVATFAQDTGLLLVEEWRLPSAVGLTIRFFDQFENAKNAMDTVAVVTAGSMLARLQESDAFDPEEVLKQPAMQHLNFYPDDVEALFEHAERITQTVEGMA